VMVAGKNLWPTTPWAPAAEEIPTAVDKAPATSAPRSMNCFMMF
jgi:hypothetical protein